MVSIPNDLRPAGRRARHLWLVVLVVASGLAGGSARADDDPWRSLRDGGHAILVRHAIAPGTGDPPGFALEDCATQRNLSADGREQARRLGRRLTEQEIVVDRVLSSRWCRALETARLMDVGPVEPFPPLDSFFGKPDDGPARAAAVTAFLRGLGGRTIVLVTHQVNITALTGVYPQSGEMVVVKPAPDGAGGLAVVGRIKG